MSSKKVSVVIGKSEGKRVRGGVSERERPDSRRHCEPVYDSVFYSEKGKQLESFELICNLKGLF